MEIKLVCYYNDVMFHPCPNKEEAIAKITQHIPSLIMQEQNEALMRSITYEEVEITMKSMLRNKAPSPDRFTADFFQICWPIKGNDLQKVVKESRRSLSVFPALNATILSLAPKNVNDDEINDFRPISLCIVGYKVISKIIANRLKPFLPKLMLPK